MGIAQTLLILSLSAILGDPVDTSWRKSWNPEILLTEQAQRGSMNHATLAFQVGLLDAYHAGNTRTLRELAAWSRRPRPLQDYIMAGVLRQALIVHAAIASRISELLADPRA